MNEQLEHEAKCQESNNMVTNWYLEPWKKYQVSKGRARRKEFWWFYLPNTFALVILQVIATGSEGIFLGIIALSLALAVALPTINVAIRRLHDIGRSGWWVLLGFLGIFTFGVTGLILLIMLCFDSQDGDNKYGPNPKGICGKRCASEKKTMPTNNVVKKTFHAICPKCQHKTTVKSIVCPQSVVCPKCRSQVGGLRSFTNTMQQNDTALNK